jgi:hypothetical protein
MKLNNKVVSGLVFSIGAIFNLQAQTNNMYDYAQSFAAQQVNNNTAASRNLYNQILNRPANHNVQYATGNRSVVYTDTGERSYAHHENYNKALNPPEDIKPVVSNGYTGNEDLSADLSSQSGYENLDNVIGIQYQTLDNESASNVEATGLHQNFITEFFSRFSMPGREIATTIHISYKKSNSMWFKRAIRKFRFSIKNHLVVIFAHKRKSKIIVSDCFNWG